MAMGVWPSRGLVLHGIEIKVSRNDWRRELADPSKAEQLARFCDFFWVAAPEGIIPVAELPPNWGLLELKNAKLSQSKIAEKLAAAPHTKDLLAAVFRAACRPMPAEEVTAAVSAAVEFARKELQDGYDKRLSGEVERRTANDTHAAKRWRDLLAAIGSADWADDAEILTAIRVVLSTGACGDGYRGFRDLSKRLVKAAGQIDEALAAAGIANGGVP